MFVQLTIITKKEKNRKYWRRNLFLRGINLLEKLRLEGGMGFRNFLRMNSTDFEIPLQMVGGKISKIILYFGTLFQHQSDLLRNICVSLISNGRLETSNFLYRGN